MAKWQENVCQNGLNNNLTTSYEKTWFSNCCKTCCDILSTPKACNTTATKTPSNEIQAEFEFDLGKDKDKNGIRVKLKFEEFRFFSEEQTSSWTITNGLETCVVNVDFDESDKGKEITLSHWETRDKKLVKFSISDITEKTVITEECIFENIENGITVSGKIEWPGNARNWTGLQKRLDLNDGKYHAQIFKNMMVVVEDTTASVCAGNMQIVMENGEKVMKNLNCPTQPVPEEQKRMCAETETSKFGFKMVVNQPKYNLESNECWASYEDMKHFMVKKVTTPGWTGWEISHFNINRSKFSGDGGYGTVYGPKYTCNNSGYQDCEEVNNIAYRLTDKPKDEKKYTFVVFLK